MGERAGVLAAVLSSGLGGTAIGATRYLADTIDPITLGALRFGIGVVALAPIAWATGGRWPPARDRVPIMGLGLLFFGLFPILFNAAMAYTTAARGALALSTLPVLTMVVAALLGIEPLTRRKSAGVGLATAGVVVALAGGLTSAPSGAWRGDGLMITAAACMALYNVWSRPFIARAAPIPFTVIAMATGAIALVTVSLATGALDRLSGLPPEQWIAVGYLGVVCGALVFFLWAFALARTTPTRVAISVAVNPITASILGLVLLGEPIGLNLVGGLVLVAGGILIATRGKSPN